MSDPVNLFPKMDGVLVESPLRCTNGSGCVSRLEASE